MVANKVEKQIWKTYFLMTDAMSVTLLMSCVHMCVPLILHIYIRQIKYNTYMYEYTQSTPIYPRKVSFEQNNQIWIIGIMSKIQNYLWNGTWNSF